MPEPRDLVIKVYHLACIHGVSYFKAVSVVNNNINFYDTMVVIGGGGEYHPFVISLTAS